MNTTFNCPNLILYLCIYPLLIILDLKLIFFISFSLYYSWVRKWMKKKTNESTHKGR